MKIKSYYKNAQNKWQENYAKWIIELIKKNISKKKNSFQKTSKDFIKTNFELMISICLFKKESI